jgi:hypothetical protein
MSGITNFSNNIVGWMRGVIDNFHKILKLLTAESSEKTQRAQSEI